MLSLYFITSMEVKGNYDRQTDQPTDRPTNRQTDRHGNRSLTSNNAFRGEGVENARLGQVLDI